LKGAIFSVVNDPSSYSEVQQDSGDFVVLYLLNHLDWIKPFKGVMGTERSEAFASKKDGKQSVQFQHCVLSVRKMPLFSRSLLRYEFSHEVSLSVQRVLI